MNSTEAANEGLLSSLNLISQGGDACNRKHLKVPTHHRMYPARLSCREFLILDHHKPSFYMLMMTYMSWTIDSHMRGALKPLRCEPVRYCKDASAGWLSISVSKLQSGLSLSDNIYTYCFSKAIISSKNIHHWWVMFCYVIREILFLSAHSDF